MFTNPDKTVDSIRSAANTAVSAPVWPVGYKYSCIVVPGFASPLGCPDTTGTGLEGDTVKSGMGGIQSASSPPEHQTLLPTRQGWKEVESRAGKIPVQLGANVGSWEAFSENVRVPAKAFSYSLQRSSSLR